MKSQADTGNTAPSVGQFSAARGNGALPMHVLSPLSGSVQRWACGEDTRILEDRLKMRHRRLARRPNRRADRVLFREWHDVAQGPPQPAEEIRDGVVP